MAREFQNQHHRSDTKGAVARGKDRDVAVGKFLQRLVTEWHESGRQLTELADKAGVAKSLLTLVKERGEGAGMATAPKLAAALGYDYPVLWQLAHGVPLCRTHPEWERMAADAERAGIERTYLDRIGNTIPPMGLGLDDLTSGVLVDLARALVAADAARRQRHT